MENRTDTLCKCGNSYNSRYKTVFTNIFCSSNMFLHFFFWSHSHTDPFPGPPNVKNTPWRSSLSLTGNEDGLGFMIGTGGGPGWGCLKLWADSDIRTIGRCCKFFDGSMWFEFRTVFVGRGGLSVTMLAALEKTPGPWFNTRLFNILEKFSFVYLLERRGRKFWVFGEAYGCEQDTSVYFPIDSSSHQEARVERPVNSSTHLRSNLKQTWRWSIKKW